MRLGGQHWRIQTDTNWAHRTSNRTCLGFENRLNKVSEKQVQHIMHILTRQVCKIDVHKLIFRKKKVQIMLSIDASVPRRDHINWQQNLTEWEQIKATIGKSRHGRSIQDQTCYMSSQQVQK